MSTASNANQHASRAGTTPSDTSNKQRQEQEAKDDDDDDAQQQSLEDNAEYKWWRDHAHSVRKDVLRIFNNGTDRWAWETYDVGWGDTTYHVINTDFAGVVDATDSETNTVMMLRIIGGELAGNDHSRCRNATVEERALFPDFLLACLVLESFRCRCSSSSFTTRIKRLDEFTDSYLWEHIDCVPKGHQRPTSCKARRLLVDFLLEAKTQALIVPSSSTCSGGGKSINPLLKTLPRRVLCSTIKKLSLLYQCGTPPLRKEEEEENHCAAAAAEEHRAHDVFVLQVAEAMGDSYGSAVETTPIAVLAERCRGPEGRGLLVTTIQSEDRPNPYGFAEPVPLTLLVLRLRAVVPSFDDTLKHPGSSIVDMALRQFGFRQCLEVAHCIVETWRALLARKELLTETAFRKHKVNQWSKLEEERRQYEYLRHYASVDRYFLRVSLILASALGGNGTLKAMTFDVRDRVMSFVYGDFSLPKRFLRKKFRFPVQAPTAAAA